ncbi:MAG: protein kinase [Polyangiaceae bacterium]
MSAPRVIGRYALHGEIAAGGMATVHLGRLIGSGGVARLVAIKRLHAQYAKDPEFVTMFLDEGRLSARIHHPNVVSVLDFLALEGELFLVMEYVQGEALSSLIKAAKKAGQPIPPRFASAVVIGLLQGLHAAHTAKSEKGEPLHIVHRDVSPQNVLVSVDGVARVLDFGVAKASGRLQTTREGHIKGKLAYMAPEQIRSEPVDHRADVYGAAVVLYELLAGRRLYDGDNEGALLRQMVLQQMSPPCKHAPHLDPRWDAIVMKGLASDPKDRYASAEDGRAIESMGDVATSRAVGQWVQSLAAESLAKRASRVAQIEQSEFEGPGSAPVLTSMLTPNARARALGEPLPVDGGGDERASNPSSTNARSPVAAATTVAPIDGEHTSRAASMSGPIPATQKESSRGSRRMAAILAGLVATAGVVGLVVVLKGRETQGSAPPATSEASIASAAPKQAAEPTLTPTPIVPSTASASPSALAGTTATPSAATSSAPASPPTVRAPTNAQTAQVTPTPTPPATTKPTGKNPNCANPYTVDANGDMKVKRECL